MTNATDTKPYQGVPRWPAFVALLLLGGIYLFVSDRFTRGPQWLLLLIVGIALVPITMAHRSGNHHLARWLARSVIGIATLAVASSAFLLLFQLSQNSQDLEGVPLLRDAALVWCANVVVFSIWYWDIDGGGPANRRIDHHTSTDFIFPQMTLDKTDPPWYPNFFDYVFLAFNTSTAFSPTDTLVLSRGAKALMMLQSLISLVVIAVLAARAVNTFK